MQATVMALILFGLVYGYLAIAEGAMFFGRHFCCWSDCSFSLVMLSWVRCIGSGSRFVAIVLATAFHFLAALVINWT